MKANLFTPYTQVTQRRIINQSQNSNNAVSFGVAKEGAAILKKLAKEGHVIPGSVDQGDLDAVLKVVRKGARLLELIANKHGRKNNPIQNNPRVKDKITGALTTAQGIFGEQNTGKAINALLNNQNTAQEFSPAIIDTLKDFAQLCKR